MTSKPPVTVDYTSQFKKELKKLYRKYRNIQAEVQPLINRLENGELPGDQVSGNDDVSLHYREPMGKLI